ncbi:hypothetical protein KAR91_75630, partial [Candidatus Pacearchaeota archaeon]|nr:hypothetical protein [Candidatus Pacearchaeota archaeon]
HLKSHLFAFVPARCKSWSCPTCRPLKANIVRRYIEQNFVEEPIYMMTLTFFHSGDVLDCWKTLGAKWNRMRTYLVKKYGRFDYLRIVEPHKKGGWPHMHILVRGFESLPKADDVITRWGFGWNYQCMRMPPKEAAKYVSKYLTKEWPSAEAEVLRQASKTRIVSVSRGMPPVFSQKSEWEVIEFGIPNEYTTFICNAIVNALIVKNADYVLSQKFGPGFIITSDVDVCPSVDLESFDGSVWERCEDLDFTYIPYGLQEELSLEGFAEP